MCVSAPKPRCRVFSFPCFYRISGRRLTPRPHPNPDSTTCTAFFIGSNKTMLKDESLDLMFSKAFTSRSQLQTVAAGTIHLRIDVVLKHFQQDGVENAELVHN